MASNRLGWVRNYKNHRPLVLLQSPLTHEQRHTITITAFPTIQHIEKTFRINPNSNGKWQRNYEEEVVE